MVKRYFVSGIPSNQRPRQSTIGSLADRALQSKQQADVKLAQAVANVQEARQGAEDGWIPPWATVVWMGGSSVMIDKEWLE